MNIEPNLLLHTRFSLSLLDFKRFNLRQLFSIHFTIIQHGGRICRGRSDARCRNHQVISETYLQLCLWACGKGLYLFPYYSLQILIVIIELYMEKCFAVFVKSVLSNFPLELFIYIQRFYLHLVKKPKWIFFNL